MLTSKDVFAYRRNGLLNDAYQLAIKLNSENPEDEWNIKALAYCLYDLIKLSVSNNDYLLAQTYVKKLTSLRIDESDEILIKTLEQAKVLADPEKKIILEAKEKSKDGKHDEALILYRKAIDKYPDDIDLNTQFGWELMKEAKVISENKKLNVYDLKKIFAEYLKLKNERPSQLHSIFLIYADKIKDSEVFKFISFLKLWDLKNLREEDYQPNIYNGKTFPSIAEKIIQHSIKTILNINDPKDVDYFLPYLENCIEKYPENIWLIYYKAKILHLINKNEKAVEFLIPVVKEKITEYWPWSLLGEIMKEIDSKKEFACYCKSLLCNGEDKFKTKVRIRLTELLIENKLWSEAKQEIILVINTKEIEGTKISDQLLEWKKTEWFKEAIELSNNKDLYESNKSLAESIILDPMPWIDSCLGEMFTLPEKPDKPRRKLFVNYQNNIIEVKVSERIFNSDNKFHTGDTIKIKGEFNNSNFFNVYKIAERNSNEKWDLFEWKEGNIVNSFVNKNENEIYWRISFNVNGEMYEGILNENDILLESEIKEGSPVFVKYFQPKSNIDKFQIIKHKEVKAYILSIKERSNGLIWDSFPDHIGIIDHINNEKNIAHFILNKEINGIIKLDQFNLNVEIGSKVNLKVKKIAKENDYYFIALTCHLTDLDASDELLRDFSGMVETSISAGFADDVYIDGFNLDTYNIQEGDYVSGVAIMNFNKKKSRWGWKAIKINKVVK